MKFGPDRAARRRRLAALSASLLIGSTLAALAGSSTDNWTAGTGSWFTNGNWDTAAPSTLDTVNISNGGTAQIDGVGNSTNTPATLNVNGGSAIQIQSGNTLHAGGNVFLGNGAGSAGTLMINSTGTALSYNNLTLNNGTVSTTVAPAIVPTGLGGGGITLTGTSNTFSAGSGASLQIDGAISGTGGVTIAGSGTVIFASVSNSYSGNTTIGSGSTLSVTSTGALANTNLIINGGTLASTAASNFSGTVSVGASGATFNPAAAASLSLFGVVSGSGAVTVASGTLSLANVETYSGTLTINAGSKLTLISNEGAPSSIVSASLVDNGTFDITGISTSGTTIASLSGSGTVTLGSKNLTVTNGSGIFTGTMTGTGPVTLTGGQLSVNGTTQNIITIGSGGTLKGIGTVGGFTANGGGTVAPGNSIGTLNVAGNFTFATGSIYQVEVDAAGNSDKINATGTATINSGAAVNVVAAAGTYAANTNYTIINATGGVTGTFGSVTSNFAFLTPTLSYTANSVVLSLAAAPTVTFPSVAVTPNQKASSAAIQALGAGSLYGAVLVSSTANALAAFDAASGEIHATLLASQYEAATSTRRTVLDRMTHLEIGQGVSLWGSLSNDWGNIKTDGNAAANARTGVEFTVGVDTAVTDHWRVGAEGGYDGGSLSAAARASHAGLSQGHMGVYGVIDYQPVVLRGLVSYSTGSAVTARTIAFTGFSDTATAKQDTTTTQLYGEAAYDIALDSVTLEPFAGLSWTNIYAGAFHETGGAAALAGASRSLENSYVTAGLQVTPQVFDLAGVNLSPMLRVALQHSFTNRTVSRSLTFLAGGPAFTVLGTQLDSDRALVDAGVTANVNETLNVSLGYYGAFGSRGNDHAVKLLGELKL